MKKKNAMDSIQFIPRGDAMISFSDAAWASNFIFCIVWYSIEAILKNAF